MAPTIRLRKSTKRSDPVCTPPPSEHSPIMLKRAKSFEWISCVASAFSFNRKRDEDNNLTPLTASPGHWSSSCLVTPAEQNTTAAGSTHAALQTRTEGSVKESSNTISRLKPNNAQSPVEEQPMQCAPNSVIKRTLSANAIVPADDTTSFATSNDKSLESVQRDTKVTRRYPKYARHMNAEESLPLLPIGNAETAQQQFLRKQGRQNPRDSLRLHQPRLQVKRSESLPVNSAGGYDKVTPSAWMLSSHSQVGTASTCDFTNGAAQTGRLHTKETSLVLQPQSKVDELFLEERKDTGIPANARARQAPIQSPRPPYPLCTPLLSAIDTATKADNQTVDHSPRPFPSKDESDLECRLTSDASLTSDNPPRFMSDLESAASVAWPLLSEVHHTASSDVERHEFRESATPLLGSPEQRKAKRSPKGRFPVKPNRGTAAGEQLSHGAPISSIHLPDRVPSSHPLRPSRSWTEPPTESARPTAPSRPSATLEASKHKPLPPQPTLPPRTNGATFSDTMSTASSGSLTTETLRKQNVFLRAALDAVLEMRDIRDADIQEHVASFEDMCRRILDMEGRVG